MSADLSNHPDAEITRDDWRKMLTALAARACPLGHAMHPDDGARCLRCEKREDER